MSLTPNNDVRHKRQTDKFDFKDFNHRYIPTCSPALGRT